MIFKALKSIFADFFLKAGSPVQIPSPALRDLYVVHTFRFENMSISPKKPIFFDFFKFFQ